MDVMFPPIDQRLLGQGEEVRSWIAMTSSFVSSVQEQLAERVIRTREQLEDIASFHYLPAKALVEATEVRLKELREATASRLEGDLSLTLPEPKVGLVQEALQIVSWTGALEQNRSAERAHREGLTTLEADWAGLEARLRGLHDLGDRLRYMAENGGTEPSMLTSWISRRPYYFSEQVATWEAKEITRRFTPPGPKIEWSQRPRRLNSVGNLSGGRTYLIKEARGWTADQPAWTQFPWDVERPDGTVICDDCALCNETVRRIWQGEGEFDCSIVARLVLQLAKDLVSDPQMSLQHERGSVDFHEDAVLCSMSVDIQAKNGPLKAEGLFFPVTGHAAVWIGANETLSDSDDADANLAPEQLMPFETPPDGLMDRLKALQRGYGELGQHMEGLARDLEREAIAGEALLQGVARVGHRRSELEKAWQSQSNLVEGWLTTYPPEEFSPEELALIARVADLTIEETGRQIDEFSGAFASVRDAVSQIRERVVESQERLSSAFAGFWRREFARKIADAGGDDLSTLVGEPTLPDLQNLCVIHGETESRPPKETESIAEWKEAALRPYLKRLTSRDAHDVDALFRAAIQAAWMIQIGNETFKGRHSESVAERCDRLVVRANEDFRQFCATVVARDMVDLVGDHYTNERVGFAEVQKCRYYWCDDTGMQALTCLRFYTRDSEEVEELGYVVMFASQERGRLTIRCSPLHEWLPLTVPTWEDFDEATRAIPGEAQEPPPT
jgi:hypothetical protein